MTKRHTVSRRGFLASAAAAIPATALSQGTREVYRDPGATTEERVRDLLGRMTLEEKVAQMRSIWYTKGQILQDGVFSPEKAPNLLGEGIGQIGSPSDTIGALPEGTNQYRKPEESIALINAIQRFLVEKTRLGIPALFHEETAHGFKARDATIFPIPPGLASTWNPELIEQAFTVVAREMRTRGGTVALSPVLDLARDPRFGRVEEFFGEDPYLTARMGIASVRGQQGRTRPLGPDKVFTTLKHFVHGSPQGGLNTSPAEMNERTLRESYLVPFEQVIRAANPAVIMASYNELEGVPSHGNYELLQKTGRERLGFEGAYFSDYGGVGGLVSQHHIAANETEAAMLAVNAGIDAELPDGSTFTHLPDLVRTGRVREERINEAVGRILAMKFEAGLFEHPYVDARRAPRQINAPSSVRLARTVAQNAIVLLKNDGVLPLDAAAEFKLAVIGPNASEPLFGGYSAVTARAVGVLAGVQAAAGRRITIEYAEGVRIVEPDPSGQHLSPKPIKYVDPAQNAVRIAQAIEVASRADKILLVVGDQPEITRESISEYATGDRDTLGLFGDQDQLVEAMIATGKPIIALLINGRPLAVTRLAEKANALLEGWYLGQEGGNAFADVLFGKVNPGGKLPVTFPKSVGDLPVFYNHHPSATRHRYVEGKPAPLFPFGYGLSYTSFDISAPRLTRPEIKMGEVAVVEVDIVNTGPRAGDEVVQIYVRDDVSSVPRPVLELKEFQRVTLSPGERRTLRFELPPEALAFWNIEMKWVVEPGDFSISAGPSSASLKTVKLSVTA